MLRPAADWELASILSEATATGMPVTVVGGNTKVSFGRPVMGAKPISTHVMRGIQSYDPLARVIVAQAGCLISDIERELATRGQMLGFEPIDMAAVFGDESGRATILRPRASVPSSFGRTTSFPSMTASQPVPEAFAQALRELGLAGDAPLQGAALTTRHRITGIRTLGATQFVFVDTPGFQMKHGTALHRTLNRTVLSSLSDVGYGVPLTLASPAGA